MKLSNRIIAGALCFVITLYSVSSPFVASAGVVDAFYYGTDTFKEWISGNSSQPLGGWNLTDWSSALFSSNKPQAYYTTPTESVEDKNGNVINYYRGGDTTTTKIIDSYNHTFNTIHNTTNNTTNNTNNYSANVKLQDFLNTYTTNNNNYTYSADFKSWYYDNTSNTYNYDASQTYYNTDNSRYYISIDNSTDEYYLVDVQYSPTFVTVNYTYNTTNNNTTNYGDVTNVYYFELTDGRNSSTLSADEVAGLDLGYDVANYELVTDDPNTLSLQHFDGDYTDSSSYGRTFYSENRSSNFVDSSEFGKAVKLPSGSAAGVAIPGLSGYDGLTFDFRVYYDKIDSLGIYLGDENLFSCFPVLRRWVGSDIFKDDGSSLKEVDYLYFHSNREFQVGSSYSYSEALDVSNSCNIASLRPLSDELTSVFDAPVSFNSSGYVSEDVSSYGWYQASSSVPFLFSSDTFEQFVVTRCMWLSDFNSYGVWSDITHRVDKEYRWFPDVYVSADFSYSTYANQWISMRITIEDGKLYYFVNGDFVGSGDFTMPTADKFYIKSSGTLYLDELRVTTGDMVFCEVYTPSSEPFDTNKVLALPTTLTANTIYARHSTPVSAWRVGGVRPSNPSIGFLYIPLYDDNTGGQAQLYDGANWVDVEAMVYDGSSSKSAKGYQFTPMGASSDVDADLKEPDGSDDPESDGSCSHEWEESSHKDATCTLSGSVTYTCTKCQGTKTETLAKLSHTWEVKQSVQTSYDESGNILTEGFTIYRCTVCNEEYKDTTGSGPPVVDSGSSGDSSDDGWFDELMSNIGEFFGTTIGGLLELIGTLLTSILGSLTSLVSSAVASLNNLVSLFSSFSQALGVFWGWLPPEIVTILVSGVTIFVLVSIVKLFLK